MHTKAYKLIQGHNGLQEGTVVYLSNQFDFGLANEDTRVTGVRHLSVTLDSEGDYPLFTVPESNLAEHTT